MRRVMECGGVSPKHEGNTNIDVLGHVHVAHLPLSEPVIATRRVSPVSGRSGASFGVVAVCRHLGHSVSPPRRGLPSCAEWSWRSPLASRQGLHLPGEICASSATTTTRQCCSPLHATGLPSDMLGSHGTATTSLLSPQVVTQANAQRICRLHCRVDRAAPVLLQLPGIERGDMWREDLYLAV